MLHRPAAAAARRVTSRPLKHWSVGLLAVAALGAIAALGFWSASDAQPSAGGGPRAGATHDAIDRHASVSLSDDPSTLAVGTTTTSTTTAASERRSVSELRSVAVRSSTGLTFSTVATREASGAWTERKLASGAISLATDASVVAVRAPGHGPADISAVATEIVLEPEAELAIEGDDLRSRAASFEVSNVPAGGMKLIPADLRDVVLSGFTSDRRWVAAVCASPRTGIQTESTDDELPTLAAATPARDSGSVPRLYISFELVDGRAISIAYTARHGARDAWRIDALAPALQPLVVDVVGSFGDSGGDIITELFDARADRETAVTEFPWGTVIVAPAENRLHVRAWKAGATAFDFGPMPLRTRFGLIAHDPGSPVYGQTYFEHDGTRQRLVLHDGVSLTGRVTSTSGAPPRELVRFRWGRRFAEEATPLVRSSRRTLTLDEHGAFVLDGPGSLSHDEKRLAMLPPWIELTIEAPGFERWTGSFDAGDVRRFDCGTIELTPIPRDLVLVSKDDFLALQQVAGRDAHLATGNDMSWTSTIAAVTAQPSDHASTVSLGRTSAGAVVATPSIAGQPPLKSPVWSDERITSVVIVHPGSDHAWLAFDRDHGKRFERVASSTVSVELEFESSPPKGAFLDVVYEWRGIQDVRWAGYTNFTGTLSGIAIQAPMAGASWHWRLLSGSDAMADLLDAGSVPITAAHTSIRIH